MLKQSANLGFAGALVILGSLVTSQPLLAQSATATQPVQPNIAYNPAAQAPRLEISLKNRRVTLYQGTTKVKSYPIAVGKPGWETPTGTFKVEQMFINPSWMNPFTKVVIPGGDPENPLGRRWIGFWTDGNDWVGMHGTPNPNSVGQAASHGCIRMYNKDVEELFAKITPGTPVTVVR